MRSIVLMFCGLLAILPLPGRAQEPAQASTQASPAKGAAKQDDFPADLSRWVVLEAPTLGTEKWRTANHSSVEWYVSLQDGKPIAYLYDWRKQKIVTLPFGLEPAKLGEPYKIIPGKTTELGTKGTVQVDDGWLLSTNMGEWGGDISWLSSDGTKQNKVSDDQVEMFLQTRHWGLMAIEGLSHLGLSRGTVVQIQKEKGQWRSKLFVDLKEAPYVFTEEADGSLLVFTSSRLLRVRPDRKIEPLLTKAFWGGLYPNSVLLMPNGELYVGMRHGVAHLRPSREGNYKMEWLLPTQEFADRKDTLDLPAMHGRPFSVGL
jgi:hypothetical protein